MQKEGKKKVGGSTSTAKKSNNAAVATTKKKIGGGTTIKNRRSNSTSTAKKYSTAVATSTTTKKKRGSGGDSSTMSKANTHTIVATTKKIGWGGTGVIAHNAAVQNNGNIQMSDKIKQPITIIYDIPLILQKVSVKKGFFSVENTELTTKPNEEKLYKIRPVNDSGKFNILGLQENILMKSTYVDKIINDDIDVSKRYNTTITLSLRDKSRNYYANFLKYHDDRKFTAEFNNQFKGFFFPNPVEITLTFETKTPLL